MLRLARKRLCDRVDGLFPDLRNMIPKFEVHDAKLTENRLLATGRRR